MTHNVAKKAVIICHSQTSKGFWDVCDFVAVLVALLCWRRSGATAMASTGINTMQALFAFSTVLHRAPSPSYSSRRLLNSIAPKLWSAVMIGNNCSEKKRTTWKSHGSRRQGMAVASSSLASSNNNHGSDFVVSKQIEGKSVLLSSPSFLVESQGEEDVKEVSFLKPTTWRASIDFKWIRENKEAVAANIRNRNSSGDVEQVVRLYEQSVSLSQEIDKLRAERNAVASAMKGKLDLARREELIEQGKQLKEQVAELEGKLAVLSERLQQEGQRIPNMTHPSVPFGSEDVASIRKEVGRQREFTFPVKDHVELGLALDLFDFEAASEVSGTKFYYLKNEAVLLELALINWTLSQLLSKGFVPLSTPDLVRSTVVEKCGFQPRGQNTQVYSVEGTDLCLAGTAEIPVGGMYMDSMLPEASLPLKLVAFSHCFRTEAGAAGAATRGLYRVHQFSKLEMFVISRPEDSDILHEELISIEEELYSSLGLHYKTLDMSSEDLGAPAYRKFDIEAWMPGLCRYGEISSASNCTDYQSRRLNIRYRPATPAVVAAQQPPKSKKGKTTLPPLQFVHTLNATACAVPRMIIAILENNQQEDGSVVIPDVLRPFMGGLELIKPKSR